MSRDQRGLAVIESDSVVVSMTRASLALAEAVTISQTKKIVDIAAAAEIYAKRQHLSEEAEQMAATVKVEALRKLGEILHATPKATAFLGGSKKEPTRNDAPTLAELGLTKKESAVAQKLAALSAESFQQVRDGHVTVAKAIAAIDAVQNPAPAAKLAPAETPPPIERGNPEPAPAEEVQTLDPRDAQIKALEAQINEYRAALNEELAENTRIGTVLDADDRVAAAMASGTLLVAENKQLRAEVSGLRERVNGLMNEKNEAVRMAKSWQRRAEKAEKAGGKS